MQTRRSFIRNSALGIGIAGALPKLVSAASDPTPPAVATNGPSQVLVDTPMNPGAPCSKT